MNVYIDNIKLEPLDNIFISYTRLKDKTLLGLRIWKLSDNFYIVYTHKNLFFTVKSISEI